MISFRLGPVVSPLSRCRAKRQSANRCSCEQMGPAWISAWMQERKVDKGWIEYYEGVTKHETQMVG